LNFSSFIQSPIIDCHVHHRLSGLDAEFIKEKGNILYKTIKQGKLKQIYTFGKNENISLYLKATYPGKVYSGGYIPWSGETKQFEKPDWDKYIQNLIKLGYDGVGEMGSKPVLRKKHVPLDSDYYKGFWESCESHSFPVLCHIGDVEDFWYEDKTPDWAKRRNWGYYRDDYPDWDEFYTEIFNVLDIHPDLKITFCHFLFITPSLNQAYRIMEKYTNINMDLSPGVELLYNISRRIDEWKLFFKKYSNRIIMGTDIGMSETLIENLVRIWMLRKFLETGDEFYTPKTADQYLTRYNDPFIGLNLSRSILENIYYKNFQRLWGKEPRELDLKGVIKLSKGNPVLNKLFSELTQK
jgi:predicted TIM-barrel fold metal-dependent hydrolase